MNKKKSGDTALMKAAAFGLIERVRYLAERGAWYVNATNKDGDTALMRASKHGEMTIIKYLVQLCAVDVNAKNSRGYTALLVAAEFGKIAVVRYLAGECGADANAQNAIGDTALMMAVVHGNVSLVRYLACECGADVNLKNKHGNTAVRLATDRGYQEIRRILTPFLLPASQLQTSDATATAGSGVAPSKELSSCSIPPSEIELAVFSQTGNIGGDYRAKWLDADVVIKVFIPDASHSTFEDEAHLWQKLRHPNVIKMHGACEADPLVKLFVCEYASNGSLIEHVTSASKEKLMIWKYLYEATLGLEYLHERGIVHGDLRCSNILIGSNGMAKLSNFGLSRSTEKAGAGSSGATVSMHWQAPEVLKGGKASYESDVYSLGMCILEAVTGKKPWSGQAEYVVRKSKSDWAPETSADAKYASSSPDCPSGDARELLWRMCCQDPHKRASLSSVAYELACLVIKESSDPCQELTSLEEYAYGTIQDAWLKLQLYMKNCDNSQYCQAFQDIEGICQSLQESTIHPTLLARFHVLVTEFYHTVKMSPEQARIRRLFQASGTTNSVYALHWRIESLKASLGKTSEHGAKGRELRWQQQRSEQSELFISGVADPNLLLNDLKTPEERLALLQTLRGEMDNSTGKYTPDQLGTMEKTFEEIAGKIETEDLTALTPEWFIPSYKLIVDECSCLGSGGFGSVNRATWLNSKVVVKRLKLAGSDGNEDNCHTFSASAGPSATQAQVITTKRVEALAIFRREVDIWFGFSNPHIIQLFGACHVGTPFFVCEYATNGTLVSYLRKYPDQIWTKLHEAALGIQYLHARNVVHGDLKGNNIVIGSDMKAKVTDFGLSSVASSENKPLVSAAWHWVAPECLVDANTRPTFASDVYSLGMCIVEAMRVVEAVKAGTSSQYCLPWSNPDKFVVRVHASNGTLPSRPASCEDKQWELVKRMCVLVPDKRIKVSTVVDELARLADGQDDNFANASSTESATLESALKAIATAQRLVTRLQDNLKGVEFLPVLSLYRSLWDHLKQIHGQIDGNSKCRVAFCTLVADAYASTSNLQGMEVTYISLTETAIRCHSLRRRLDKLKDAYFLSVRASTAGGYF
ncbi:hypothetical protein PRIC1_014705 [Phytophthora ramorum]